MSPFSSWPNQGSLLWVGRPSPSLKESEIFQFARLLICGKDSRNHTLFETGVHPDFYLIEPTDSRWIKIDQIRALIDWANTRPQISTRKLAIIYPADALNLQAANALLKTLEEPMPEMLFILVSVYPKTLPATLLSRCHWIRHRSGQQPVEMDDNLRKQILQDLKKLRKGEVDPVIVAASWLKNNSEALISGLMVVLYESLTRAAHANTVAAIKPSAFEFLDLIYEAKRCIQEKAPANMTLLIENLLIQYIHSYGKKLDSTEFSDLRHCERSEAIQKHLHVIPAKAGIQ